MLKIETEVRHWPLHELFVVSRETFHEMIGLRLTLTDTAGRRGRGEGMGVTYAGETVETMRDDVERVRIAIEAGATRVELLDLVPAGGARCAVDAALWDLEAKRDGVDPFAAFGVRAAPVASARTIGIRSKDAFEAAARRDSAEWRKIKVGSADPVAMVEAVRRGSPRSRFIVDPNQAWPVEQLKAVAPAMASLGVELLEQPIPVGAEEGLEGWSSPVPLCADELINTIADPGRARGRFQAINIELDKTGGLTAVMALADAARAMGFGLMVGCMCGPSLAMVPAMVLAQRCRWVDLDGPLLQSEDDPDGFDYRDGIVTEPHKPVLWG